MRLLTTLSLILGLGLLSSSSPAPAAQPIHAGIQLSESNFDERTSKGLWFIEHYSPFCPHCKQFAATWIELCNLVKPYESRGLYLAQLDCIAQGDLCIKLGVEFYPQMKLYKDGHLAESYSSFFFSLSQTSGSPRLTALQEGEKKLADIKKYLDVVSSAYASNHSASTTKPAGDASDGNLTPATSAPVAELMTPPLDLPRTSTTPETAIDIPTPPKQSEPLLSTPTSKQEETIVPVNPHGKVLILTRETWNNYTSKDAKTGPIFIKFYAPWCGHCQRLAPIWSDLSQELKTQVNIAELNCDEPTLKPICRQESIPGFPTLVFYQDGIKVEYPGPRSLQDMKAFAKKASVTGGAKDITSTELTKVIQTEEVFFLYLFTNTTPQQEIISLQESAKSFLGTALVYKSNSTSLFNRFNLPTVDTHKSYLLVFKDFDSQPWAILTNPTTMNQSSSALSSSFKRFINTNSLPLLPELSSFNYEKLFNPRKGDDRKLLVLVYLAPGQAGDKEKDEIKIWAKQWRKSQAARDVKIAVDWVWTSGANHWGTWLNNQYDVQISSTIDKHNSNIKDRNKIILVIDPTRNEYYDRQANGYKISWKPSSVFQTLLAVELGKVEARVYGDFFQRNWIRFGRSFRSLLSNLQIHWLASTFMLTALIIAFNRSRLFRPRHTLGRSSNGSSTMTPDGVGTPGHHSNKNGFHKRSSKAD